LENFPGRAREREPPRLDRSDEGKGEHRPGGIVEARLGDKRLGDLRAYVEAVEEGYENGGVGRRQHGADQQRDRGGNSEDGGDGQGDDDGGYEDVR